MIVIPARAGSSRFPGKPLAVIHGHTLLSRVIRIGLRAIGESGAGRLIVATDDEAIAQHAQECGVEAVLTPSDITTGSERALAAVDSIGWHGECIVNLQGDAPFVEPGTVAALIRLVEGGAEVATPVVRLDWPGLDRFREQKRLRPASGTTCIRMADGAAQWFSKAILPHIRHEDAVRSSEPHSPVWQHLGVYAYRPAVLRRFVAAPMSPHEKLEELEQLRLIELGIRILTVEVPPPRISMSGIDTPADAALAERLIAEHGDPIGEP